MFAATYSEFLLKYIQTREPIIQERSVIMDWEIVPNIPSFFQEKMNEIKLMTVLGLDNFVAKAIAIFIDEIILHILIAHEISPHHDYSQLLEIHKKEYGHQFLKTLNERNLIHLDDYAFCSKYLNDQAHGGERLRNIELHNLVSEKFSSFQIREEEKNELDDFAIQFLQNAIKTKPEFMHIGARDMVSRGILNEIAKLHDLLNRNADILSKISHL